MSLPDFSAHESLYSVPSLLEGQFAPDDRYRLFAQRIYPMLVKARPALASCYCQGNGRKGVEPVVLLGISLLQFMERLPDRQAMEHVRYHVGWKLALGLGMSIDAPDPSTLVYFRQRLLDHEQGKLAFDAILAGLIDQGLVTRRSRQRLDSTHVLGAVARLSALECVRETLRLSLVELDGRQEVKRPEFWNLLWERYVSNKIDPRLEELALAAKYQECGQDIVRLWQWLVSQEDVTLREGKATRLLPRALEEHFEIVEGKPLKRQKVAGGALQNPNEPDAQWSSKDKATKGWVGYKVQVAETVAVEESPATDQPEAQSPELGEPQSQAQPPAEAAKSGSQPTASFLTAMETQPAASSEEAGMRQVLGEQAKSGLEPPPELYVDSGYVSAEVLKEAAEQGRQVIGPALASTRGPRGFRSEDFEVEVEQGRAICPAGEMNTHCTPTVDNERGTRGCTLEWRGPCRSCPHRGPCAGGKDRTLKVGEHHSYLQQRRREQQTPEFARRMRRRNAVEGTISELARGHGLRRARYRGLPKVKLQNHFIGAACNAKRYIRLTAHRLGQTARRAAEAVSRALTPTAATA